MRWTTGRRSDNIEDRRGVRPAGMAIGGGGLIVLLILMFLGADPRELLNQTNVVPTEEQVPVQTTAAEEELKSFVSVVLAETEDVWNQQFQAMGRSYQEPTLVLFTEAVQSACGYAGAAVGPFYCPGDQKVYLDLSFFDLLDRRLDAPGDFAQAYVIAHEIGHHVQNLLGISEQVRAIQQRSDESTAHEMSVRLELQADFLAGVWAHHAQAMKQILEPGDIEEAMTAATAIGDDRLQMEAQGYIVPDSFTHGTSEQRLRWFKRGFETGDMAAGDTFNAPSL